MGYEHLNIDERETLLKIRAAGQHMRQIGDEIGRSPPQDRDAPGISDCREVVRE